MRVRCSRNLARTEKVAGNKQTTISLSKEMPVTRCPENHGESNEPRLAIGTIKWHKRQLPDSNPMIVAANPYSLNIDKYWKGGSFDFDESFPAGNTEDNALFSHRRSACWCFGRPGSKATLFATPLLNVLPTGGHPGNHPTRESREFSAGWDSDRIRRVET